LVDLFGLPFMVPFTVRFRASLIMWPRFSNIYLITPKNFTTFIQYLYSLCFSYMFRCYRNQHHGELVCHLLKITCSYASIIYVYRKSYVVHIKDTTLHWLKLKCYTMV